LDTNKLLGVIKTFGDRQEDLAFAIGLSRSRLSAKLHGRGGAYFSQPEIVAIKKRYSLSSEEINDIFFADVVSKKDTIH